MSLKTNDNTFLKNAKTLDDREMPNGVPYTSLSQAKTTVIQAYRSRGLRAYVDDGSGLKAYWYKDGTEDTDLVLVTDSVDLSNYAKGAYMFVLKNKQEIKTNTIFIN